MANLVREDVVHYAVRRFLKQYGWHLLAGQYPNGSDDEIPCLNVMDPGLACDNSPDSRRHSKNKLVPDLLAYRDGILLIIEMKPRYDAKDEKKLEYLLHERRADFLSSLRRLAETKGYVFSCPVEDLVTIPCLGMSTGVLCPHRSDYAYFTVVDPETVFFRGNTMLVDVKVTGQ